MSEDATKKKEKKSLKDRMSCDLHDCGQGLHCFILTKKMSREIEPKPKGMCQFCGAENVVDWEFVRQRDPNKHLGKCNLVFRTDLTEYVVQRLRESLI